jgi:hypothetical protein
VIGLLKGASGSFHSGLLLLGLVTLALLQPRAKYPRSGGRRYRSLPTSASAQPSTACRSRQAMPCGSATIGLAFRLGLSVWTQPLRNTEWKLASLADPAHASLPSASGP